MEVTLKGTEVLVLRDILEDVIAKHTREIGAATKKMPEAGLAAAQSSVRFTL
jgi:hypothetical protein